MKQAEIGRVLLNEKVGPDMWRLVAELPETVAIVRPGQFVHVRVGGMWDPFLRRPFSPTRVWRERGEMELIYRVVGRGTAGMTELRQGDKIDSLGPLGSVFTPTEDVVMVGGGVGIAPMVFAANEMKTRRCRVVIGGRNKDELFWQDLFPATGVELRLCTDDGSVGHHGFVTDVLPELLAVDRPERVFTCGPEIMMIKVAEIAERVGVPCEVSLERRMGCSTGGCLACVCDARGGGHYKVCQDGPVFDSREVRL